MSTTFGKRLAFLLKEAEITQGDLFILLGIKRGRVAHLVSGRVQPKMDDVFLLADLFCCPVAYLTGGYSLRELSAGAVFYVTQRSNRLHTR
jgi:transcriptional regulator with XRE-family HTH domain